jgi:hypothetical protein
MPVDPTGAHDSERTSDLADSEVAFWRGFVEWWARERSEPVPQRAWEALARASARRDASIAGGDALQHQGTRTSSAFIN